MAYSKTTWSSGDTITAAKLNNMESGIAGNADDIATINQSLSDIMDAAYSHNTFFRGKSLGSSVSSAQHSALSGGTFDDLYIGDYWTISSVNYRIGSFDYWRRCGESSLTTRHALVVPDSTLYSAPMNASNITTGGYPGSAMFTCEEITVSGTTYTGLADAISTIQSAFGSYLVSHSDYMANAVTDGIPTGGAWQSDRIVDLMSEQMVYGSSVMMQMSSGGTRYYNQRVVRTILPLFLYAPYYQNIRANYWLRDVVSSTNFASVYYYGYASNGSASTAYGVRPFFLIS